MIFLSLTMLLLGQTVAAESPVLKPVDPAQFYVVPDRPATLRWQVASGSLAEPVEVVLRGATGAEESRARAVKKDERTVEVVIRPARGYHEVVVAGRRFGLLALPPWQGAVDPFFAIDGGLSWLVSDTQVRVGLIGALARSGVGMVRERLSAGAVSPAVDRWDWDTGQGFESLRRAYRDRHVAVLELAHDAPLRLGHVGKYPEDLAGWAGLWSGLAARWRSAWGAVEVWNEPDIFFGGDLPADQYVPLAKAMAYGFAVGKVDVPLVGGVTADFKPPWLDAAARSGLLERVDVFSFHTYGRATQMEPLVGRFRGWLRAHGRGEMPLWISECGRPWSRGPERPPLSQDAVSALDITMKGVEARACGIQKYFPFVLPYYDENNNNFGMADRRGTPMLSLAAYAQMIQALGGRAYLGDLRTEGAALPRARVFGDGSAAVAVLYTGRIDAKATVRPGLPVTRAEGIDGRSLSVGGDGSVPIPDGLVYVWLDRARLGERLVTDTAAMKLHAGPGQPAQRKASPIILRYQYDAAEVAPTSTGYLIKNTGAQNLPLGVRIFNLGPEPVSLRLVARVEAGAVVRALAPASISVAARSTADVAWNVDTLGLFDASERATVLVEAGDDSGVRDRVAISLVGEPNLARVKGARPLPITDASSWTQNHSPGAVTLEAKAGSPWRLKVAYTTGGDHWAYPSFRLPEAVKLAPSSVILVRARCQGQASVRMFLWEGETGVGYITPDAIIAPDGRWHVARVPLADLIESTANAPDPNHKLDPDSVRKLGIGMNARSSEATLEVSQVYVVP